MLSFVTFVVVFYFKVHVIQYINQFTIFVMYSADILKIFKQMTVNDYFLPSAISTRNNA